MGEEGSEGLQAGDFGVEVEAVGRGGRRVPDRVGGDARDSVEGFWRGRKGGEGFGGVEEGMRGFSAGGEEEVVLVENWGCARHS